MTKEEAIKYFEKKKEKSLMLMEESKADTPINNKVRGILTQKIEALDMAISALKGGWIPIEKREPDDVHERVYVTQLVPKSPCKPNGTTVYITRFIDLHKKKKYITAWQPLPESYKKGE